MIHLRFQEHGEGDWTQAKLEGTLTYTLLLLLIGALTRRPWIQTQVWHDDEWQDCDEDSALLAALFEEEA